MQPGTAFLYDGQTARRHAVAVALTEDRTALRITGDTIPAPLLWPLQDLRAVPGHEGDARLVVSRHADGADELQRDPARLLVDDPDMAAWIERTRPRLHKRDLRGGTGRRIGLRIGGALAAVLVMIFVILPALSGTLARLIPLEREQAFGRAVRTQVERSFGATGAGTLDCDAPEGRAALDTMVARLTAGEDLGYPLQVTVLDHPMMNAFAVPGGQVVIMRGLLDNAGSPDMVAAVLAHEIGHVVHRDPTRHALRTTGSVGLLGLLFGDFTGSAAMVLLADHVINASYAQGAETAADGYAHELLRNAGLPPDALAEMFETFRREYGDTGGIAAHFVSHPALAERIEAARNAPGPQTESGPVLDDGQWNALRAICIP